MRSQLHCALAVCAVLITTLGVTVDDAFGFEETGWVAITELRDGWGGGEGMAVFTDGPTTLVNPNNCGLTTFYHLKKERDSAGLITNSFEEKTALLLAAVLANYEVNLVIEGCTSDNRPKIVQVRIRQPQ